jgi:hypothetical protein
MLISLSILALVMSFLPGALRLSSRVWESDAIFSRAEGVAAFRRVAEERLAGTMPIFVRDPSKGLRVEFEGEPGRVAFAARAPAGPAGGGVYRFELTQGPNGALVLRQSLYRLTGVEPVPAPGATHVSPAAVGGVAFRYFGAREIGATPAWHDAWPRRDALPDLVEISIAPADGAGAPQRSLVELRLRPPPT